MRAWIFCAAIAMAACSPAPSETATPPAAETPAAPALSISGAYVRPSPNGVSVAAGYLTITNAGAGDELVSASSPRAGAVQLHTMTMDGGMMQMREAGGLAVPANGQLLLAPEGNHLMFMEITAPFVEGETVPVTLNFAQAGAIQVVLPVQREAPAAP